MAIYIYKWVFVLHEIWINFTCRGKNNIPETQCMVYLPKLYLHLLNTTRGLFVHCSMKKPEATSHEIHQFHGTSSQRHSKGSDAQNSASTNSTICKARCRRWEAVTETKGNQSVDFKKWMVFVGWICNVLACWERIPCLNVFFCGISSINQIDGGIET